MPTAGPAYTGTGANFADGGTTAWTNPGNIVGNTTTTAATCSPPSSGATSQRLRCSGFGFTVPAEATILGVQVEVEQQAANANRHRWNNVRLLVAGTEAGNSLSDASAIPTTKGFKTFGSAAELWGLALTPANVNAAGFGVSLKIDRNASQATTTSLFRARITVTFAGVTVTPGAAALTLTGYAPVVALSDNRIVTPDAASLALATHAPSALVAPGTPEGKAAAIAAAVGTQPITYTFGGITFNVSDCIASGPAVSVTVAAWTGAGASRVDLPTDNPYVFVNPPLSVPDGGFDPQGRRTYTRDDQAAAQQIVYDAVTARARQLGWVG